MAGQMKFAVDKAVFVVALASVEHAIEKRSTLPILSNVRISALGRLAAIKGTDLDLELTRTLAAGVIKHGDCTVNAAILLKLARKLGSGDSTMTLELVPITGGEPRLRITSGRTSFELATLPTEDFPCMVTHTPQAVFALPAGVLRDGLAKTAFAMSMESARFYLNGIFLEFAEEGLRMVAMDGHRLGCKTLGPVPAGCGSCAHVIIPAKTVAELQRLLNHKMTADICVTVHPERIAFQGPDFVLVSKCVDGTFPDYRRVVPAAKEFGASIWRDKVTAGIELVSAISEDKARAVAFTFHGDELTLRVSNPEHGVAADTQDLVHNNTGRGEFTMGFNARYFTDIAKLISSEVLDIWLLAKGKPADARNEPDEGSPAKITDPADDSVFYVLMPMRV